MSFVGSYIAGPHVIGDACATLAAQNSMNATMLLTDFLIIAFVLSDVQELCSQETGPTTFPVEATWIQLVTFLRDAKGACMGVFRLERHARYAIYGQRASRAGRRVRIRSEERRVGKECR